MAEFLSEEWVAGFVGAGASPGPTGTLQVVVTGGPDGDGKWHARIEDGIVAEAALGTRPAPDLTLTVSYADGTAMAAGDLDPSVAFMQGRMKTAGDPGLVLDLLAGVAGDR
jgi:SCP-2 sterol transfer family